MLQEKVSRDKDRVNVTKFDAATDMSGGLNLHTRFSSVACRQPAEAQHHRPCGSASPGTATRQGSSAHSLACQ